MSKLPGFIGPSNVLRSRYVDAERSVNEVIELRDAGTPKVSGVSYKRPGLRPFIKLSSGPVRGLFAADGRAWAVGGTEVVELYPNGWSEVRGLVELDGNPVTMSCNGSNGHQLFITSGKLGYILDLNSNFLSLITAAGFPYPCSMGDFCDGFFLALRTGSIRFQVSVLYDGTLWAAANYGAVSESPNNLVSLVVQNRQVWLAGSKWTEPWANNGYANFSFAPVDGAQIQSGTSSAFAFKRFDNSLVFVGQDDDGIGVMRRMDGYSPKRVSPYAVDLALQRQAQLADVRAWTFQENGHLFYVLDLPANDTSWAYDASNGLWSEWAEWDTDQIQYTPFAPRCHCFAFGKHLVGDRESGVIYEMSSSIYSDTMAA